MDSLLWRAVNSLILVLSTLLNLQAVEPCSPNEYKTLTETKGRFSSPNFPRYFQKATQCNWLISVDPGYVVTLEFGKFDVGHDAECSDRESRTSFVEVRDGLEYKNKTIGVFCGSSRPNEISSTGNHMWIRYVTSGYRSTKFEAHYSATKDSSAATIILLASAAIIGTILFISVAIAIIKRKTRNHDDEAGLSPTRDNEVEQLGNNRACALEQIPSIVLLGETDGRGLSSSNEHRSSTKLLSNEQKYGHVTNTNIHLLHGQSMPSSHDNGINQNSVGEQNLAMTDIENENYDVLEMPIDVFAAERRRSNSGSILTSTKVIFVQDSSSSGCSTPSGKSCEQ